MVGVWGGGGSGGNWNQGQVGSRVGSSLCN